MQGLEQFRLDELVQPIPGDFPAGVQLSSADRDKLDNLRREHDPEEYDQSDPKAHEPRQVANWPGVARDAERLLKTISKDFSLAARLTEAWTKQHGLAGALGGFTLLRRLCAEAWGRVHPKPEPEDADDVEMKVRDFRWLDDPDSGGKAGARYPMTVREIVLTRHGDTVISAMTCRPLGTQAPSVSPDQIRALAAALPAEAAGEMLQTVEACLTELETMLRTLNDSVKSDLVRVGVPEGEAQSKANEYLPGFTETRKALEDCKLIAEQLVASSVNSSGGGGGGNLPVATRTNGQLVVDGAGGAAPNGVNREQLYQYLRRVAETLERVDPHSPVPFLIHRAVELRDLRFPELVEVLTKEAKVLDFMKNKIEPPAAPSASPAAGE